MKGIAWAAMLNSPERLFQSECPDRQRQDPQGRGAGRRSLGRIKVPGVKLGERLYEVNVLDLLSNSKAQTVCEAKCCLWLKHLACFVWAKSLWFNCAHGNSLGSEDLRAHFEMARCLSVGQTTPADMSQREQSKNKLTDQKHQSRHFFEEFVRGNMTTAQSTELWTPWMFVSGFFNDRFLECSNRIGRRSLQANIQWSVISNWPVVTVFNSRFCLVQAKSNWHDYAAEVSSLIITDGVVLFACVRVDGW